jgi:hypothetical protein
MLLSVAASARRHGVNPWAYVRHILSESAARKPDAGWSDLLPDAWPHAFANRTPAAYFATSPGQDVRTRTEGAPITS